MALKDEVELYSPSKSFSVNCCVKSSPPVRGSFGASSSPLEEFMVQGLKRIRKGKFNIYIFNIIKRNYRPSHTYRMVFNNTILRCILIGLGISFLSVIGVSVTVASPKAALVPILTQT